MTGGAPKGAITTRPYYTIKSGECQEDWMFYLRCWRDMQSFLVEVVRDASEEYPFAEDVLELMRSVERRNERKGEE